MDTIYANNDNRKYCTENNIPTNFARNDPKPKDEPKETSRARRIIGNLGYTASASGRTSVSVSRPSSEVRRVGPNNSKKF